MKEHASITCKTCGYQLDKNLTVDNYYFCKAAVLVELLNDLEVPIILLYSQGCINRQPSAVEPGHNQVPRDWQNLFAKTRFRYIQVLFHILYYSSLREGVIAWNRN